MPEPNTVAQQAGKLTIAAGSLAASIDKLDIPFETEMTSNADATITGANDIRRDVAYNSVLFTNSLKQFILEKAKMDLKLSDFDDQYSSDLLAKFNDVLNDFVQGSSAATFEAMLDKPDPDVTIDKADYDAQNDKYEIEFDPTIDPLDYKDEYKDKSFAETFKPTLKADDYKDIYKEKPFAETFKPTLQPSDFADKYAATITSLLTTYINAAGTGLDSAVEAAIYDRARARILPESNRNARRITTQLMARMPYGGELVDALAEADTDVVTAMSDVNNKILEEQGKLAYQAAMDRIEKALVYEKDLAANYYKTQDVLLQATTTYDELSYKEDALKLQEFEANKDNYYKAGGLKLQADTTFDELSYKEDALKLQEFEANKDNYYKSKGLNLQADTTFDELEAKKDTMKLQAWDSNRERYLKADISMNDFEMRKYEGINPEG